MNFASFINNFSYKFTIQLLKYESGIKLDNFAVLNKLKLSESVIHEVFAKS